ncbi:MAG: type II toxin-antitoxin system VapC family toxin [Verrucomicrobiae bacterium]|nr:type II toxin-antitoxin system VapC family toxin [Verrucomicrobiae bacterium]
MLYFDTSYLVRLYTRDPGWEEVRALAGTGQIACCLHGRAEIVAAFHRKLREGALLEADMKTLLSELDRDSSAGAFRWLALSPAVIQRLSATYARLPSTLAVRAADAIHLACAAEAGCARVYSNDLRLLTAAPHFGIAGHNIL